MQIIQPSKHPLKPLSECVWSNPAVLYIYSYVSQQTEGFGWQLSSVSQEMWRLWAAQYFFVSSRMKLKKVYYFYYSALGEGNGAWFTTRVGKMQWQLAVYTYLPWQSTVKVSRCAPSIIILIDSPRVCSVSSCSNVITYSKCKACLRITYSRH